MKNLSKIILLLLIIFFYFFANNLLARIIYRLECRELIPWIHFSGHSYNLIDLNIPHFIAFIVMGIVFNAWAFLFSVIGELLQVIIKHSPFSFMDVLLNLIGSGIGITLTKLRFK